ncbi:hypothetical protein KQX54_010758 [Cotesia glomerata]|uniref:Uncharacterized protein n=1 Tax=Cotesia glomerata TaxID=32391 RepID=A0AAV7IJ74_COTGL|nr:hypothetical protein KQX54_010758 [Cotesia glomerata]
MESFRSTMALEKLERLFDPKLRLRQRKLLVQLKNKKEKPKVSSYVDEIGLIGKSKFMETLPVEIFLALQRINVNIDGKRKYWENQRRNFFRGIVLQHLYFVGLNENLAAVDATEIQKK